MRTTARVTRPIFQAAALLLFLSPLPVKLLAAGPEQWVPLRWDGGPLEVSHRAGEKALADPSVRDVIGRWYEPGTLDLLDGMPMNCLLLTFSGGSDREVEQRQQPYVRDYVRKAHERGFAAVGIVYPGADAAATAAMAAEAHLDGVMLEGKFAEPGFAGQLQKALQSRNSAAIVIPLESSAANLRKSAWAVVGVQGTSPGVGKAPDAATASATAGLWIDSNLWVVRSFRLGAKSRPVWISHGPGSGSSGDYLKSIADAAAAGGRWIVTLEDGLRRQLLQRDAKALALWRNIGTAAKFFAGHADWEGFAPFGAVGIVLDTSGPHLDNSEEFLNLVGRRQIPYRVIDRARLDVSSLAGLRAVLAFDLAPPLGGERDLLRKFAAAGGLVVGGPSWGNPPKDQPYTVVAVEQGELAVYKEEAPDPQSVARDLNDLLTTPDFEVSFFNAPSVLPYVSSGQKTMLIQLVNYADAPAISSTIWLTRNFVTAKLFTPENPPVTLQLKRRGDRTEIALPAFAVCGAVLLEASDGPTD